MNFCSHCGSKRIALAVPEGDNRLRFCCPDCHTIHYQNPKLVTGCLVTRGEEILLCKRAISPRKGWWNLPAGYLENGETVEQGALRETMEESAARAAIQRVLCIYSLPHVHQVYVFFLAEWLHWEDSETPESEEIAFFAPDAIPFSEMAFSSSNFAINKYLDDLKTGNTASHLGTWDGVMGF